MKIQSTKKSWPRQRGKCGAILSPCWRRLVQDIRGSLSTVEIMTYLYFAEMRWIPKTRAGVTIVLSAEQRACRASPLCGSGRERLFPQGGVAFPQEAEQFFTGASGYEEGPRGGYVDRFFGTRHLGGSWDGAGRQTGSKGLPCFRCFRGWRD